MNERRVTACVLIIGNEILSGRTQDLNLQYIAKQLNLCGISIAQAHVIPDLHDVILNAVNDARAKHDYVLTTGGIGPTHDDITAECVAAAFGVPLEMNDYIAKRIRQRPAAPDVMENRLRMAYIPKGARLIDNLTGGPPGFSIENVYCMAGIPSVLQAMLPTIQFEGGSVVKSCSVTAFMGESEISRDLGQIQERFGEEPSLGSYPFQKNGQFGTTLVMRGTNVEQLNKMMKEVKQAIRLRGQEPQNESYDWDD
ncbi:MAG: molybdopterin-binding protein [Gammaproteobacteria bacterium]|nr:molybdopterin-binding protein [Gammaproteobacteria bacterium]